GPARRALREVYVLALGQRARLGTVRPGRYRIDLDLGAAHALHEPGQHVRAGQVHPADALLERVVGPRGVDADRVRVDRLPRAEQVLEPGHRLRPAGVVDGRPPAAVRGVREVVRPVGVQVRREIPGHVA